MISEGTLKISVQHQWSCVSNVYFKVIDINKSNSKHMLFYSHIKLAAVIDMFAVLTRIFTLYAKALSLDIASRIWDVFFRDGEEFLFRTAIGEV